MTTNDETPPLNPANLHRAMPRYPDERKHFTPSKTPLSILLVGIISGLCIAFGVVLVIGAGLMLYYGGHSTAETFGVAGVLSGIGFIGAGIAWTVIGVFGLAGYHVAKAIIDIRDMMRHRGN